ncbi:MAG: cell wall metabolism sensor histidine kinase WalK, partial [Actinomycetota bacterium]|nr:cell wall metabolism sensor histidine kinase WalK [Actinomycetota bacterium]
NPPTGPPDLGDTPQLVAHVIRALGYLVLSSWLWTGVRSSIRTRFVASFVALLVVVVLALSTALTGVITNNVEAGELDRVSDQLQTVSRSITRTQVLDAAQEARLATRTVQQAMAEPGELTSVAEGVLATQLFAADYVLLMAPRGFLRGYAGEGPYVTVSRTARVTDEDILLMQGSGPVLAVRSPGFQDAGDVVRIGDNLAVVSVAEVTNPTAPGQTIGMIALVDWIDTLAMRLVEENVAADASLIVGRRVVASSLRPRLLEDVRAADLVTPGTRETLAIDADNVVSLRQELPGQTYYSAATEVRNSEGTRLGYLVLSSPARVIAETQAAVTRTMFLVALGAGAIVLVLAYLSGRRITRPIQLLTDTARRVREGDLKAQTEVAGEDEVGQLGATFNEMTTSLNRMTNDLKDAAQEEQRLRARIETIIESMADGLVAVGPDGRILAFNREAELLTGVSTDEALGRDVETVIQARNAQGEALSLPIFDLAEGATGNIFLLRTDGDAVPVTVVSAALRSDDGETAGGVAVIRDMTREREIERMKSEFLSNISHELRTPLTPIKGYAEILNRKEMPADKTRQFTRGILESTERLERIVELLVDFAALEAGRLSPRAASVDIAEMVSKLATEWEARTPRHSVVAQVGPKLPKVIGDERLLRRSLEEILDNAVKFSPQGGTITLQVKGALRGNGHERRRRTRAVEVTIADEGIGIAPDDVNKIFSDFHQLDGSETRSYGGLGLGLAFVRRIVEAHEGTVRVESQPEQGTRLTVSIPAVRTRSATADTPAD